MSTLERSCANLVNLPMEIVIKYVLPQVGAPGLRNLSLVDSKWREIVQTFIKTFNTIVDLSKPSKQDLFNFMTDKAVNIVMLNLEGCLNSPIDKKHPENLKNVILRNKNLEEIYIPNTWISAEVVDVLARDSEKLKVAQLSSFKIRLYDIDLYNDDETGSGSRKLWPCSCWGTELEMEEECKIKESLSPDSLWGPSNDVNQNEETEEKRLLNNLRLLEQNTKFQDLAWQSMGKESRNLMDPLNYHEYKCRKGMFYDGNNDQDDFFLHQVAHIFGDSDSDTSDYDE